MRFANLHVRTAALASLTLVVCSCQTAQKPVPLLPPATAPALKAAAPAPAAAQVKTPAPAPAQTEAPAPQVQNPSAAEPVSAAAPSDPIADLIAQVEKDYQTGLTDYQAGKPDAAKQDFDKAFNALLGSHLDIRSDDRLQKEFDRIVEGVNRLDLGNLAANGLGGDSEAQQQKSEPAPIDETNEIAPPTADPRVKAKAQAEIASTHSDLPLMMTDQVAGYISYFSNRGRYVSKMKAEPTGALPIGPKTYG